MNNNTANEKEQEKQHTGIKYKVDKNVIVYIVDSFYTDVLNNK
jgi:hypothetical protein